MRLFLAVIIVIAAFFYAGPSWGGAGEGVFEKIEADFLALGRDYRNFYLDSGNLMRFGASIAGAGVLANTSFDREFQEFYRDDIKSDATNDVSKILRLPGEPAIVLPLLAGIRLALPSDSPAGLWSQRTLRGLFLGGPAAYAVQVLAGGGRPEEGVDKSRWRGPFHNNNSLSGHSFIGSLPLVTAAMMQDDPFLKGVLYALSPLAGLSRINDDKHYLSQVALGWYLAYLSARAVEKSGPSSGFTVSAVPVGGDGVMVLFSGRF